MPWGWFFYRPIPCPPIEQSNLCVAGRLRDARDGDLGVILAVVGRASTAENRSMSAGHRPPLRAAGGSGLGGTGWAEWLAGFSSAWAGDISSVLWPARFMAMLFGRCRVICARLPCKQRPSWRKAPVTSWAKRCAIPTFTFIFIGFSPAGISGFYHRDFPAFVTELCGPILAWPAGAVYRDSRTLSALGAVHFRDLVWPNIAGTCWRVGRKRYSRTIPLAGDFIRGVPLDSRAPLHYAASTPVSVILFSVGRGALWLQTVCRLTSGLVAHILCGCRLLMGHAVRNCWFFSGHQWSAFLGALAGRADVPMLTGRFTRSLVVGSAVPVGAFSRADPICRSAERRLPGDW